MFRFTSFLTVLVVLAGVGRAQGGSIYMDFGDFPGEVTKEPHVGWINVLAVSQGVDRPTSGSGAQLEWADATHQDFAVTKVPDKSTPKLLEIILTGTVHDKVVIDFVLPNLGVGPETTRYRIELGRVRLTSYSFSDGVGGAAASETLTLNYETIKWTYTEIVDDEEQGTFVFGWDVVNGVPINIGVPEPGTLTLATLALVGLLAHGHHRRKE
jgi:type VI secretion system Hcp family effector